MDTATLAVKLTTSIFFLILFPLLLASGQFLIALCVLPLWLINLPNRAELAFARRALQSRKQG